MLAKSENNTNRSHHKNVHSKASFDFGNKILKVGALLFKIRRINLLVFYRECHSLIGYATRYLFCDR